MKILKSILILMFCLLLVSCAMVKDECNQREGNEYVRIGMYEKAFNTLRLCENSQNVSGLTLGQLALLYGNYGFGEIETTTQRKQKVYKLFKMAALKGNIDAISSLVGLYKYGDKELHISPQENTAICLKNLIDSNEFKVIEVEKCIKKR